LVKCIVELTEEDMTVV